MSKKPVVVAMVGAGASEAATVGLALGALPGVCGAGAVARMLEHLGSDGQSCACGEPAERCPFWRDVFALARRVEPGWDPEVARRLVRRWLVVHARSPWFLPALVPRHEREELQRLTRALLVALGEATGSGLVVEGSAGAAWAWLLGTDPHLDVRFVHLTRDGRDAVATRSGGAARAVLSWSGGHLAAEWALAATRRPRVRVRFEDFALDPAGVWSEVCAALGLPAPSTSDRRALTGVLAPAHQAAVGRQPGPIRLAPDRAAGPARRRDALVFWSLAGLQALRYGYRP